jgi:hypothetical protein
VGGGSAVHDSVFCTQAFLMGVVYVVVSNLIRLQIIMFSDLEVDYINPIDLCNQLNQVRASQAFLADTFVHLISTVHPTRKWSTSFPNAAHALIWAMVDVHH